MSPLCQQSRRSGSARPTAAALIVCLALVFAAACLTPRPAAASGTPPKLPEVGFRSIGVWIQETKLRMDTAVWYPTRRIARNLTLDGWTIRAAKDSPAIPARYPVILISHDAAASRLATHDLASNLARHGFVVIAPTHPGDNINDTSRLFRAGIFAERPYHLIFALDAVAASPAIGPIMDRGRIGLLGVGSGAASVLQLAGAEPDLILLGRYCTPENTQDPLCSSWAKTFHSRMQQEFTQLAARTDNSMFTPFITWQQTPPPPSLAAEPAAAAQGATPSQGTPAPEQETPPLAEPRRPSADNGGVTWAVQPALADRRSLRAVGLLAPGQTGLFSDQALHAVTVPVGIVAAAEDAVYPMETGAARLQDALPQRPALRVAQNARHADLLPSCPPMFLETFPDLCGQTSPDAASARKTRNEFFVRFYQKLLGEPLAEPSS